MRVRLPFLAALVGLAISLFTPALANAAPAWPSPTTLSKPRQRTASPDIAINSSGEAVAVWHRIVGSRSIVQSAFRPPGGTWSKPTGISSPKGDAQEPRVAINAAGKAVVVWAQVGRKYFVVKSASRSPGGTWSAPSTLSANAREQASTEPQVAIDSSGEAIAIWKGSGNEGVIQSASRPPGGAWSRPVDISKRKSGAGPPKLAIDPGGEAVAVWFAGHDDTVQGAERPPGGTWSKPTILSRRRHEAGFPRLAVNTDGEAVVVWSDQKGKSFGAIQSVSRPAGGEWSDIQNLATAPGSRRSTLAFSEPEVALDAAGEAVVVWERFLNNKDAVIQSAMRSLGGTWSKPTEISEKGNVGQSFAGIDAEGDAVAVWVVVAGNNKNARLTVQGATRPSGAAWSDPADISAKAQEPLQAKVVVNPAGKAVAVWRKATKRFVIQSVSRRLDDD